MTAQNLIDLDHLEKYVAGDVALRDEILTIYADQAELLCGQFEISQTDEGWRNTAHAMKGAARGVGSWRLGDLCEEAETLIGPMSGKGEKRAAILVSLRNLLMKSIEEARSIRDLTEKS